MKKLDKIILASAVSLLSFLYYAPFLNNYFVWDDFCVMDNFISGKGLSGDLRIFGHLLLWVDFLISKYDPLIYYLIRIGLHIANSGILFLLLYSLSNDRLFSLFTAVIFAASGVGCDAILWKAAFLTSTGFFFYILVLYLYVEGNKKRNKLWHNLALAVFLLAMFNKEEIASIPFMILFIEMLFFRDEAGASRMTKIKRVLPYFLIIIMYILLSIAAGRVLNIHQEQFDVFLSFRPLHTLLSGFTSFFISPGGKLSWENPFIYITAIFILLCFLLIRDRKWLLFGLGWTFVTFLPQSLTSLSRFDAPYLLNSISRHLYLPSVGPAILFSVMLQYLKGHLKLRSFVIASSLFFTVFIFINYERVEARGKEWREEGERMRKFLFSLKKIQPTLPENSYICLLAGPEGSYTLPSVRAFYKNPKIYWTDDPRKDAYIYLYFNDRVIDKHESIMRVIDAIQPDDIGYVLKFYDLKRMEKEKIEFLRSISLLYFKDAEIHFKLAITFRNMGMLDDAETEFKAALAITPMDMESHYYLGLLYALEKKYDQATGELQFVAGSKTLPYAPMADESLKSIRGAK